MAADDENKEPSVAELKEIASNADAPEDKLQAAAAQAARFRGVLVVRALVLLLRAAWGQSLVRLWGL